MTPHETGDAPASLRSSPPSTTTATSGTTADDESAIVASVQAHPSITSQPSDHDSEASDEPTPPTSIKRIDDDDVVDEDPATCCVVCFERAANITLDPCGHANLCDVCVSRLVKRRCPTCRARARKVSIRSSHSVVTKAVREVIAERKQRETNVLKDTLQIVFLGPDKVGKKTLVRKLISKFPLVGTTTENPAPTFDVFSDGTDFSANATIAGSNVRLTVLRRTTLTSRRMVLDDIRVLKPDVLVLCCSAHVASTYDAIVVWDKVLRNNIQKPRVWALTLDNEQAPVNPSTLPKVPASSLHSLANSITTSKISSSTSLTANPITSMPVPSAALDSALDVTGTINSIFPPELRPKKHYFVSYGETFSIGFRTLAKDIVTIGREARYQELAASIARDEELAASLALAEARTMASQEAAGTLNDQAAANLVIANNGIAVPGTSNGSNSAPRAGSQGRNGSHGRSIVGRSFSLRGLRERSGNGNGVSISGIYQWLTGSHES